jgi:hypothetical protein
VTPEIARIGPRQAGLACADRDIGVAPLVNAYGGYRLAHLWRAVVRLDRLVSPNCRALDIGLKAAYDLTRNVSIEGGYRMLEGGADNDSVCNFAWFGYAMGGGVLPILTPSAAPQREPACERPSVLTAGRRR